MMRSPSPSKLAAVARWALLVLLTAALLACGPRKPAVLSATPESVALIQDSKERCVKIAKVAVDRLENAEDQYERARASALDAEYDSYSAYRGAAASLQTPRGSLEAYLKGEAAPELAVVDRANDLVRIVLPQVPQESSADVAAAVQALLTAEEQVCNRARNARPTAENYQENLDFALRGYNTAEAKLKGLYTLSPTDAQFAIRKYSAELDSVRYQAIARQDHKRTRGRGPTLSKEEYARQRQEWEAVQTMQEQQQAQHEEAVKRWREREAENDNGALMKAGPGPEAAKIQTPRAQRGPSMQSWYADYQRKVEPVHAALGSYVQLRRSRGEELRRVCAQLMNATAALLADPAALDSPDFNTSAALKRGYSELQEAARFCANGQDAEAAFHLGTFESAMKIATRTMGPYQMTP
ncbi:MAG: hypothetical protein ACJ75H_22670 [Thermoanaerobaculia bacterium]